MGAEGGAGVRHLARQLLRLARQEERTQAISEAKETIELLKAQTDLMRQQGEDRESEWRRMEQTWHDQETRMESRIEGLESDHRRLVLTVTSMGLCDNAPDCVNYNPGDRRIRRGRDGVFLPKEGAAED